MIKEYDDTKLRTAIITSYLSTLAWTAAYLLKDANRPLATTFTFIGAASIVISVFFLTKIQIIKK